jgi:regulator of nucleoside diphosphate kinase
MTLEHPTAPTVAPAIRISADDYDLIAELAIRMEGDDPALSRIILREIERASVCEDGEIPSDVVAIGSQVTFADDSNGSQRTVQLVLPGQADIACNRISVMTSMGAGLIGLQTGGRIDWPCPDGRSRSLTILHVENGLAERH